MAFPGVPAKGKIYYFTTEREGSYYRRCRLFSAISYWNKVVLLLKGKGYITGGGVMTSLRASAGGKFIIILLEKISITGGVARFPRYLTGIKLYYLLKGKGLFLVFLRQSTQGSIILGRRHHLCSSIFPS